MDNSKKYLISTCLKSTWPKYKKNSLIFSSVSAIDKFYDKQRKYKKIVINNYHWKDKKRLERDFKYLENFYEIILSKLYNKLNNLHNKNYSKKFWRILIGPWLGTFLHIYFDRWQNTTNIIKKNKIDKVIFLKIDEDALIPYDSEEFIKFTQNDFWNQIIYQNVIINLIHKKKIEFKKINSSLLKSNLEKSVNPDQNNLPKLSPKHLFMKLLSFPNKRDYKYLFYRTYLGSVNETKLSLKFKQLPILLFDNKFKTKKKIDYEKRKNLRFDLKTKNKFEKFFINILNNHIPKVFVENFEDLVNFSENSNLPQKPKTIFSSNALWYDSAFMFHVAKLKEKKIKLVYGQHGGAYGISKNSWPEDHEREISDKYLTWGWSDNRLSKKTIKFYVLKKTRNYEDINRKENLLVLMRHRKKYFQSPESSAGTEVFPDYITFCSNFLFNIKKEIKNKAILRFPFKKLNPSSIDFFSNLEKNFIFDSTNSFEDACNKSKLIVNTANSTTFCETLSHNFPTIVILDKNTNPIRNSAKRYMQKLNDNQILYYDPISAANFVNKIWNSGISDWWNDIKTIKAVKEFRKNFANSKQDFITDLKNILQ